jgi:hypothetical protein
MDSFIDAAILATAIVGSFGVAFMIQTAALYLILRAMKYRWDHDESPIRAFRSQTERRLVNGFNGWLLVMVSTRPGPDVGDPLLEAGDGKGLSGRRQIGGFLTNYYTDGDSYRLAEVPCFVRTITSSSGRAQWVTRV